MLILVGASATGKTEIVKELVNKYKMEKMVTYTTRNKRVGEIDGVDYHFISKEKFLKLKANNSFVETVEYNDNYYGTLKKDVNDKKVVILEPNGLKHFYNVFKNGLVSVYIQTNKEIRMKRMRDRQDDESTIIKRLNSDDDHFNIIAINHIDFIVNNNNDDINKITEEVYNLYKSKI